MERVATLIRANLNDLIDRAEEPEKMLRQVVLDLENQLMQVKTQVAIAMATRTLLDKKQVESDAAATDWMRRAELAIEHGDENLAKNALERSLSSTAAVDGFRKQVEQQTAQVEDFKAALRKLELKLEEARTKAECLAAQHRRARAMERSAAAQPVSTDHSPEAVLERLRAKIERSQTLSEAGTSLAAEPVEDRFAALEKRLEVDRLLEEIRARRGAG